MRNFEFHIDQALKRYHEAEAMALLLQKWAEHYTEGEECDWTLRNGFALLEDAMTEVFRAICQCKDECTAAKINRIEQQRLAQTVKGGNNE